MQYRYPAIRRVYPCGSADLVYIAVGMKSNIPGDEEYASDWGGWTEWDNAPEWEEYLLQLGESTGETINVPDVPPEDTGTAFRCAAGNGR